MEITDFQPRVRGDIIDPTPAEIERNLSVAGTYLFVIDDSDIRALKRGKLLCFYMEDFENIFIQWRKEVQS